MDSEFPVVEPMPEEYSLPETDIIPREKNPVREAVREVTAEAAKDKAKEACALYADGMSLQDALTVVGLSLSGFFSQRNKHPDVKEAWNEAKEIKAEAKLDGISNLRDALIDGTIEKDIYHELISTEKWLVSKLSPDTYGAKTSSTTDNRSVNVGSIQILQTMSDDDILRLVGAEKSPQMAMGTQTTPAQYIAPPELNLPPTRPPHEELEVSKSSAPFTKQPSGGHAEGKIDELLESMTELLGDGNGDS